VQPWSRTTRTLQSLNPLIIGDLFFEQARPWEEILKETQGKLLAAARATVDAILDKAAASSTKDAVARYIVQPNFDPIVEQLG
jgi:hypothetical protein